MTVVFEGIPHGAAGDVMVKMKAAIGEIGHSAHDPGGANSQFSPNAHRVLDRMLVL